MQNAKPTNVIKLNKQMIKEAYTYKFDSNSNIDDDLVFKNNSDSDKSL